MRVLECLYFLERNFIFSCKHINKVKEQLKYSVSVGIASNILLSENYIDLL